MLKGNVWRDFHDCCNQQSEDQGAGRSTGAMMSNRPMLLVALLLIAPLISMVEVSSATQGRALACSGSVCLNEALPNPNGLDDDTWPNGEWMEIHNSGTVAVDVLNWQLVNKANKILDFDSSSIVGYQAGNSSSWTIQPGDYMVIARNGSSNFYLTNSADWITMKDSFGNTIDQASWNTTASGTSLEEDPTGPTNDWIETNSPTPGSVNSAATGPVVSDLRINEVMANPWPSNDNASWPGGEWFEIWNSGQSDIDLTGWSVVDNAGNIIPFNASHLVGSNNIIAPNEYRIVAVNSTNQWGVLNNGAETLRLQWPNGTLSQSISWSSTVSGFSLVDNPGSGWIPAAFPSPGQENPMPWDLIVNGTSPIRISEVLVNSTIDGAPLPDGEWVEVHNQGNGDLDMQGWMIMDGMGNITQIDMMSLEHNQTQPGTSIVADGRRLIQFYPDNQLWDNYNHLMLIDIFGTVVSKAWWTSDPGLNVSLVEPQNLLQPWQPAAWPTPGQPEPGTTIVTGDVVFNEIYPDAVGNDTSSWPNGEWIEIMNAGNNSVDIANWHFTSGSRNFNINVIQLPFKSDTILQPGEIALVAINGSQGFYLKNTNPDTIELRDSSNQIISTITYNSSTEGESNWFWNGDWSQAPWPTPGQPNPSTSPYTGDHTITITEILAHCSDGSIIPSDDWVEVLNDGNNMIDLKGWRMLSDDGDLFHMRDDRVWNTSSSIIAPGERMVFTTPNWFISGLGASVTIEDPDGVYVDSVTWDITTDCVTMDANGSTLPWPTPGEPEPDIDDFAGPDDLIFSRFMFEEKSQSTNDEFFEITNTGNLPAILNGWQIVKTTTGGVSFNGSFTSLVIQAGESVVVSPDASAVKAMGDTTVVEAEDVMDFPVWLPNSGAAIQLVSPDGTVADTFVYGNGPTSVDGWSGIAIGEPVTTIDRILYLRGDGCGAMPDEDKSSDWEMRWSMAGASHFCGVNTFSDDSSVTPLVGPEHGLNDLITILNQAQTDIHVHIYQLHHSGLAQALIDAENRGVEVTVVIHEPEDWWGTYSVGQSLGIAGELENAGAEVLQFTSSSSSPYQYIHSKVAVIDSQITWIGSGNWKESSQPSDGSGNRDWGVIVDSTDLASIVLERMAFDEDPSQLHVEDATFNMAESGSYEPPMTYTPGDLATPINGPFSGELLTCPDDCMQGLSDLIESADEEILLSLQYFEMDWYWGWGENQLLDALEQAAADGVSIRLAINQHYANENPGIREAVNELNSWEGDVEAILMSENETVTKLHNKGVIIDGESVLVSSINWGDNAILQNREMGLVLHSAAIASVYEDSFWEDWDRLDMTTDTDIDGLPDYWELEHGFQRSQSGDQHLDPDGDGLDNAGEFSYGSDPNSNDTDGDCIQDADEIIWAQTMTGVSAGDALMLTDADGDGEDDSITYGCVPVIDNSGGDGNNSQSGNGSDGNQTGGTNQTSLDSDGDGVPDDIDECPNTNTTFTDTQGCSKDQNKEQSSGGEEKEDSGGFGFMMILVILGGLILVGAGAILLFATKGSEDVISDQEISLVEVSEKSWEMPVLDGTSDPQPTSGPDMSKFPGWSVEQVNGHLEAGWTEDQLAEWYKQQMDANSTQG